MNCIFRADGRFSVCISCGFRTKCNAASIIRKCVGTRKAMEDDDMETADMLIEISQSILPGKALARCVKCGGIESMLSADSVQDIHHTCQNPDKDIQPVAMPSHATVAFNAAKAAAKHIASGLQSCVEDKIIERFTTCSSCEMYNDVLGKCSSCGCYVNMMRYGEGPNKLSIASESCPIGKWQKETK